MTDQTPPSLKARWHAWEQLSYPTQQVPPGIVTDGVDWALTDGDLAAVFHDFFVDGPLDPDDQTITRVMLQELPPAVATLRGDARHYFSEALEILVAVDQLNRDRQ
jgi:hypothetical protein